MCIVKSARFWLINMHIGAEPTADTTGTRANGNITKAGERMNQKRNRTVVIIVGEIYG